MKILEKVHEDWIPIIRTYLHQEPLSVLFNEILPNISYKPEKENIFNVFTMPLKDIKVVILQPEPYPLPFLKGKEEFAKLKEQGVFMLNTSLTSEVGNMNAHYDYWEYMIKYIISHISLHNPCIWLFATPKNKVIFETYIRRKFFVVKNYDDITIEDIPINSDWNYIMDNGEKNLEYTNSILKQMNINEIKWQ